MTSEPCFNCTLSDCDSTSDQCQLRIAARSAHKKRKHKKISKITETERASSAALFLMWRLERDAQRSEVAA